MSRLATKTWHFQTFVITMIGVFATKAEVMRPKNRDSYFVWPDSRDLDLPFPDFCDLNTPARISRLTWMRHDTEAQEIAWMARPSSAIQLIEIDILSTFTTTPEALYYSWLIIVLSHRNFHHKHKKLFRVMTIVLKIRLNIKQDCS